MKYILLLTYIIGCTIISGAQETSPLYKIGDCANLFEPTTGKGNPDVVVKIEELTGIYYKYRWWLGKEQGWDTDIIFNKIVGKYKTLEKMSKVVECPH